MSLIVDTLEKWGQQTAPKCFEGKGRERERQREGKQKGREEREEERGEIERKIEFPFSLA